MADDDDPPDDQQDTQVAASDDSDDQNQDQPQQVAAADQPDDSQVIDPNALAALGAPPDDNTVTDPEILRALGGPDDSTVTDPEILKALGTPDQPAPQPEGAMGTFLRRAAHGAVPALGAAEGGELGAGIGATLGSAVPIVGTGVGGFVGGVGGAIIGGYLASKGQSAAATAIGADDNAILAADADAHPWAARAGDFVSNLAGFSPFGAAANVGRRVLSGGISGAGAAASAYAQGESPGDIAAEAATQAAAGFVAPNVQPWVKGAGRLGENIGVRMGGTPRAAAPEAGAPVAPAEAGAPAAAAPEAAAAPAQAATPAEGGTTAPYTPRYAWDVEPESTAGLDTPGGKGAATDATPPPTGTEPRNDESSAKVDAPIAEVPAAPADSGMNVQKVGQVEPTVSHAIAAKDVGDAVQTAAGAAAAQAGQQEETPGLGARPRDPAIDAAVSRATAPQQPADAGAMDRAQANLLVNRPRELRQEAARRGMTPEALKAQANAVLANRPAEAAARPPDTVSEAPAPAPRPQTVGDQLRARAAEPPAVPPRTAEAIATSRAVPKDYKDMTPTEQAAFTRDSNERNFQRVKAVEPNITREEYDARRRGGMAAARAFLTDKLPTEPGDLEDLPGFLTRIQPARRGTLEQAAQQHGGLEPATAALQQRIGRQIGDMQAGRLRPDPAQMDQVQRLPITRKQMAAAAAAKKAGAAGAAPKPAPKVAPVLVQVPAKANNFLGTIRDDVRKVFAPHLDTTGAVASNQRRTAYGQANRIFDQTNEVLRPHEETMNVTGPADRQQIIARAEGGAPGFKPTPAQQALLDAHETAMKLWEQGLSRWDRTKDMNFVDNFVTHMYEPQNQAAAREFFGNSSKFGGRGSLQKRTYDTYEDAAKAGIKPLTDNLLELDARYGQSMKNTLGTIGTVELGKKSGHLAFFNAPKVIGATGAPSPAIKGGPPEGWVKVNVPMENGRQAYAPPGYANVLNNFYNKGLGGGALVDSIRKANNAWTQQELGINGYHFTTMANEAMTMQMGRGISEVSAGEIGKGLKTIMTAPGSPVTSALTGLKVQKGWLDPKNTDPILAMMQDANARPIGRSHALDYTFQERGSFIKQFSADKLMPQLQQAAKDVAADWKASGTIGQKIAFPVKQVGRVLQTIGAPLFDKYIPMLKTGQLYEHMASWMDAKGYDPQKLTAAQYQEGVAAARKFVDSTDNAMGEMITENLNLNPIVRDVAQMGMRSFSWNVGFAKQVGGGTYAAGKGLYRLARSGGSDNIFSIASLEHDPRATYAIAFPLAIALTASVVQFLRTGTLPGNWRDVYAPRTGGTVSGFGGRGQVPEHELIPGYHKDVVGWLHDPLQEAYNKMNGLLTTAIEEVRGKNFIDQPVFNPNASALEQAQQRLTYLLSKVGPISVKTTLKKPEPGSKITAVERAIGFHAPGAYIQDPAAYDKYFADKAAKAWKAKQNSEKRRSGYFAGGPVIGYDDGGEVADLEQDDPGNEGPDSRESPPPTEEIEEWREQLQKEQGNPVTTPITPGPLGPNDRGVDPVLGWPHRTRIT